ncbi:MAG: hypothetical protein M1818_001267 [Claussenomyces sp. TS43310]|nr:MAG: hypothetical protein M1818_001267 [Claussenomyces sp. TS43310]
MAPVIPKKRTSIRAKVAKSGSGPGVRAPPVHREGAVIDDGFLSSKKDKRTIKHSSFVNRIEKANRKPLKRRRPSKKLVTTLESLADALPDAGPAEAVVGDAKIKQKSMKTRPGATKRREKLEKMERDRFGKNMAQLTAGKPEVTADDDTKTSTTASRWAALRGFISQTMEQKEEFIKR